MHHVERAEGIFISTSPWIGLTGRITSPKYDNTVRICGLRFHSVEFNPCLPSPFLLNLHYKENIPMTEAGPYAGSGPMPRATHGSLS